MTSHYLPSGRKPEDECPESNHGHYGVLGGPNADPEWKCKNCGAPMRPYGEGK